MIRSAAVALTLVLLAGVGHAQPKDVAKADALFREGRTLMKKGDYETACPKLEESYRIDPAAGTGINLGDCFEKQGKVASALLAYQAARALLQPGDPRIGPVEKEIAVLDKRAPRLTIKLVSGAPGGTTVKRDGREVEPSKLGVPVAVNPGKIKVTVTAPGRDTAVFRVSLVEGKSRELEVGPGEDGTPGSAAEAGSGESPTRPSASRSDEPSSGNSSAALVSGGVGVVGLGVGVVFAWQAIAKAGERDDVQTSSTSACNAPTGPDVAACEKKQNLDDRRGTYQNVAIVGFGVAVVAAVTTTILWPRERAAAPGTGLRPVLTPTGVGLTGRF
ncbi:MAG: hypothetical protein IPM35_08090 [Myxococcales bacterium]|nr:hypothetical protein [Myxococcales bacterium]